MHGSSFIQVPTKGPVFTGKPQIPPSRIDPSMLQPLISRSTLHLSWAYNTSCHVLSDGPLGGTCPEGRDSVLIYNCTFHNAHSNILYIADFNKHFLMVIYS